jgi:hypothetical protein
MYPLVILIAARIASGREFTVAAAASTDPDLRAGEVQVALRCDLQGLAVLIWLLSSFCAQS